MRAGDETLSNELAAVIRSDLMTLRGRDARALREAALASLASLVPDAVPTIVVEADPDMPGRVRVRVTLARRAIAARARSRT